MAQRKKKRQGRPAGKSTPKKSGAKLGSGLAKAETLLERKKLDEARETLLELNERYPDNSDVLSLLVNTALEQQDIRRYQQYLEQLVNLQPDDPDMTLNLAGAYLLNVRPALSLHTFRHFLEQWPEHEHAGEAQQHAAKLEEQLAEMLPVYGLEGSEGLELAALHEQVSSLLEQNELVRAREIGQEFLQRKPDFPPVLNNISQAYYVEGNIKQAIETTQQALELDADNIHALSNITRYHCLLGHSEEAQQWASRLKAVEIDEPELFVKQAEALSFLGDDQGVLDVFQAADRLGIPQQGQNMALLYHLVAVATMRQGDEKAAKRLWKQALKIAPWFSLARENLDDLRNPPGKRHAPWPFSLGEWLQQSRLQAVATPIQRLARGAQANDSRTLTKQVRQWLKDEPGMAQVLPMLLDRGDPAGREFALRMAIAADLPELNEALRDFALSQRGPDTDRNRAATTARDAELLPGGMITMWLQGEQREVMIMGFEITGEPQHKHRPQTAQLAADATLALQENRPEEAEALLLQALELEPDAPDLKNNLAMAYGLQGDIERAEEMVHDIHRQHPDYLFATLGVARMHIRDGELDEAKALLEPLLARKRFHTSEFTQLCQAEIDYWTTKGEQEGARAWLDLWQQIDPQDPNLLKWQARLRAPGWMQKLLNRR